MFVHEDFKKVKTLNAMIYHLVLTKWENYNSVLDESIEFSPLINSEINSYRELWWNVGGKWNWNGRIEKTDQEITSILSQNGYFASKIIIDGKDGGIMEYSLIDGIAEIMYFGLLPELIGKGFGSMLFNHMINDCLSKGSSKIWLHTCSLDSPQALPFYQRKGFTLFKITRENENIYCKK